ncbi:hypothetical protein ABK040_013026 [Willaertia magna]
MLNSEEEIKSIQTPPSATSNLLQSNNNNNNNNILNKRMKTLRSNKLNNNGVGTNSLFLNNNNNRPQTAISPTNNNNLNAFIGQGLNTSFNNNNNAEGIFKDFSENSRQYLASEDERLIEINADLILAMSIYFHTFYSITWLVATISLQIFKHSLYRIDNIQTIIFSILLVIWTFIEFPRLYIGYSGNLQEKIPRIFAFMILSTIQPLFYIYFILYQPKIITLDYIICSIQLFFYFIEYLSGIKAMRNFTKVSGVRYRLYFNKDGTLANEDVDDNDGGDNNKNEEELNNNTSIFQMNGEDDND